MPELRTSSVQQMDERCPACGNGFMRPTGVQTMGPQVGYQHKCNAGCGHIQNYNMRFPYIVSQ